MSRYATLDPTLTSSASDKRKASSLIAPSIAKKKRTSKKLLIQVRTLSFLNIKPLFILIIFILCDLDQNSATIGCYRICQFFIYW
jgi:hypothetical protein